MNQLRQLFVGLVTALGTSLLVLAAVSLALAEGTLNTTPAAPTPDVMATQAGYPAPASTLPIAQPPAAYPAPIGPTPTSCLPPEGWMRYTVQAGDTVESLAAQANLPVEEFRKANCLVSSSLPVGSDVRLPAVQMTPTETPPPPLPTLEATNTPFSCPPPPAGWIIHVVQSGETLYRLGQAYGVTAGELQIANCLPSTYIVTGTRLYVPNVPTRTPIFKATATPTRTGTPVPPTDTEIPSETPTNTVTPTETQEVTPKTPSPQATVSATADTTPSGNTAATPGSAATPGGATTPGGAATPGNVTTPGSTALPSTQAAPSAGTDTPAGTSPATQ